MPVVIIPGFPGSASVQSWADVSAALAAGDGEIVAAINDLLGRRPPLESLLLYGRFATFNPRLDGLDAPISARWTATDVPGLSYTHVSAGANDWIVDNLGNVSSLVACAQLDLAGVTPAQIGRAVNALYQGAARVLPGDDFTLQNMTPRHLCRGDRLNDQFTDVIAGDHLTRGGLGVTAVMTTSPLFGVEQGQQLTDQASFYACPDGTKWEAGSNAVVNTWIGAITQNADGGVMIGKEDYPPGAQLGFSITSNSQGGFGFEWRGSLGVLNADTPFGNPPADDGRMRAFHAYRSVLGAGRAGVRCDLATVELPGLVGDLTDPLALFGLVGQAGVSLLAEGSQSMQVIAQWLDAEAENVIAHLPAIEAFLQAQLAPAGTQGAVSTGNLVTVTTAPVTRVAGVPFQPSVFDSVLLLYSFKIATGGLGLSRIVIKADPFAPPTTVRLRTGGGLVAGAFVDDVDPLVTFIAPPHWFVIWEEEIIVPGAVVTLEVQTEQAFRP